MKKIYVITAIYAKYENNKVIEELGKEILFAVNSKEEAKEIVERYKKNTYLDRIEWFKNHRYGLFATEYNFKEIDYIK